MTIHASRMAISLLTENKFAPSNAISRMALLKCVNGKILQKGCSHLGKESIEKNVPASKN